MEVEEEEEEEEEIEERGERREERGGLWACADLDAVIILEPCGLNPTFEISPAWPVRMARQAPVMVLYLIATRMDRCDAIENGHSTRVERARTPAPTRPPRR